MGVIEIEDECGAPGCDQPAVGVLAGYTDAGMDVYFYCDEHSDVFGEELRDGMLEISRVCGAPAAHRDVPCGAAATQLAILRVDGVEAPQTVSLCAHHATEIMDALP